MLAQDKDALDKDPKELGVVLVVDCFLLPRGQAPPISIDTLLVDPSVQALCCDAWIVT